MVEGGGSSDNLLLPQQSSLPLPSPLVPKEPDNSNGKLADDEEKKEDRIDWVLYKDGKQTVIKPGDPNSDEGEWVFTGHRVIKGREQYQIRRVLWKRINGKIVDEWKCDDEAALGYKDNGWYTLKTYRRDGLDVQSALEEWERGILLFFKKKNFAILSYSKLCMIDVSDGTFKVEGRPSLKKQNGRKK